ncbi:MAG: transcription antitermination factor NusB [Fimbriimonas sp.]
MHVVSRRKSRVVALTALYEVDLGGSTPEAAFEAAAEEFSIGGELAVYAERLVSGVVANRKRIDGELSALITEYDFSRVAAVDRNVMRIGAYELMFEPAVPPAVTINEAIEIAKRFSTGESGRFVNGVLGRLLRDTEKANWDPDKAPPEFTEDDAEYEPEPEVEEITVDADSDEGKKLARIGGWKLRNT